MHEPVCTDLFAWAPDGLLRGIARIVLRSVLALGCALCSRCVTQCVRDVLRSVLRDILRFLGMMLKRQGVNGIQKALMQVRRELFVDVS